MFTTCVWLLQIPPIKTLHFTIYDTHEQMIATGPNHIIRSISVTTTRIVFNQSEVTCTQFKDRDGWASLLCRLAYTTTDTYRVWSVCRAKGMGFDPTSRQPRSPAAVPGECILRSLRCARRKEKPEDDSSIDNVKAYDTHDCLCELYVYMRALYVIITHVRELYLVSMIRT